MFRKKKLPETEEDIKKKCVELGVTRSGSIRGNDLANPMRKDEMQRRIIEAERALREHRLWIVALVSAIASALSAAAAWMAVLSQ